MRRFFMSDLIKKKIKPGPTFELETPQDSKPAPKRKSTKRKTKNAGKNAS